MPMADIPKIKQHKEDKPNNQDKKAARNEKLLGGNADNIEDNEFDPYSVFQDIDRDFPSR